MEELDHLGRRGRGADVARPRSGRGRASRGCPRAPPRRPSRTRAARSSGTSSPACSAAPSSAPTSSALLGLLPLLLGLEPAEHRPRARPSASPRCAGPRRTRSAGPRAGTATTSRGFGQHVVVKPNSDRQVVAARRARRCAPSAARRRRVRPSGNCDHLVVAAHGVGQVAVRELDALGRPGRARRVDQREDVLRLDRPPGGLEVEVVLARASSSSSVMAPSGALAVDHDHVLELRCRPP